MTSATACGMDSKDMWPAFSELRALSRLVRSRRSPTLRRPGDGVERQAGGSTIAGEGCRRILDCDGGQASRLEALDDTPPARPIRPGAMNEHGCRVVQG